MRSSVATYLDDLRRHARDIAVVRHHGNRRTPTTYGELAHLAGRVAAYLEQNHIQPGDRVLLWAANSAEWIAAFYGCILRGALAVPLDAYGTADFAQRICTDVQPSLLIGDPTLLAQLPSTYPKLELDRLSTTLPATEAAAVPNLTHTTPLQILFTSGTTGDPKGIIHTHGNILASVAPIELGAKPYLRYERPFHPVRFLHTLPLSHVFGQMMGLWIPPIFAAEVHFEDRLAAPRLIETIHRERISVLAAVPRIFALLKTHLELADTTLESRIGAAQAISAWKRWLRFRDIHRAFGFKFWSFVSGGGVLPAPVEQFFSALGFVVVQGYGMTETTALITLNHPFHVKRGTIGKPLPGRETKITPEGELLVRGPMISTATWSQGRLHERPDAWLATGDMVETQPTGELHFLGRASEVIVTANGINIHPEDLEAAIEQEPAVRACAVVALQTPSGPEPCAVLAMRADPSQAAIAIQNANTRLAEPQRLRRWVLWPEPDLPRTSTGKVRRRAVADWLAQTQNPTTSSDQPASTDWLLQLVTQLTGEPIANPTDASRLTEDLHLDSLARVQLAAAIEERTGVTTSNPNFDNLQTLGELLLWLTRESDTPSLPSQTPYLHQLPGAQPTPTFLYPHWPWSAPIRWLRAAFTEAILRPLIALLANPTASIPPSLPSTPMLIIANHVTTYDVPLLAYALPGHIRRHLATAMAGEMLEDYRHYRNPESAKHPTRLYPPGPLVYLLLTALFNVFPLPRRHGFQRSFAHAGEALDRGFHVLVFPEGTRSTDSTLGRFRPGIGLLVKQSGVPVLPMAMRGLNATVVNNRWFRSGNLQVIAGEPLQFPPDASETEITTQLQRAVQRLLDEESPHPGRQ